MKLTRECITSSDEARFWSKVDRQFGPTRPGELTPCWPWMKGRNRRGYGRFWLRLLRDTTAAHRVAFVISAGTEGPRAPCVAIAATTRAAAIPTTCSSEP